jgi:hypothetical protein
MTDPPSSFSQALAVVGRTIRDYLDAPGGTVPFQVYVYEPADEWKVRQELQGLRLWLEADAQRITCAAISLSDLLWEALAENDRLEDLVALERQAQGDARKLQRAHRAVAEILLTPPTVADRVLARLAETPARTAVFLYRAGSLFPAIRTSGVLEDLVDRVACPVTMLYPGTVEGEFGLRFMGIAEPTYGYRARIITRGVGK